MSPLQLIPRCIHYQKHPRHHPAIGCHPLWPLPFTIQWCDSRGHSALWALCCCTFTPSVVRPPHLSPLFYAGPVYGTRCLHAARLCVCSPDKVPSLSSQQSLCPPTSASAFLSFSSLHFHNHHSPPHIFFMPSHAMSYLLLNPTCFLGCSKSSCSSCFVAIISVNILYIIGSRH